MALDIEATNLEIASWNRLLNDIGQKLNLSDIQRLAIFLEIPERPLELIVESSNPGSAFFKELDKNADLWFGDAERLKELMLFVNRNDLSGLIEEFLRERSVRATATAAASVTAPNVTTTETATTLSTATTTAPVTSTTTTSSSYLPSGGDEISIAIDFLCENIIEKADWKRICRKLGLGSTDFDSLKPSSSSSSEFRHFLNIWRERKESAGNLEMQQSINSIINALKSVDKNSTAEKLFSRLQNLRGGSGVSGGGYSRRA